MMFNQITPSSDWHVISEYLSRQSDARPKPRLMQRVPSRSRRSFPDGHRKESVERGDDRAVSRSLLLLLSPPFPAHVNVEKARMVVVALDC